MSADRLDTLEGWQPPPLPRHPTLLGRSPLRRHLLAGLPALLAGTGVLVLAGAAAMSDQGQLRAYYFEKAGRYFLARDYQAARIGFERCAEWDGAGGAREVRYDLAVCLDALGEHDRAAALIDALAPEDQPGDAPSHVFKARRLWSGSQRTAAVTRAVEKHLLFAHQVAPDSIEVNALLGQFYLGAGQKEKAVPFLEKASHDRPVLLLPLARACLGQSNATVARHWAREARRIFRHRAEVNLEDHDARLLWAEADLILEEFAEAVTVLQREALLKSDERYPRALSRVCLAWADAVARQDPADLSLRLALLERGLVQDPANIALLGRFSALIRGGGNAGDRARAALLDRQASGLATGPVRYALGLDAWEHGRAAEARLHWEQACRLTPQIPAFANNLAWILATGPDPDLNLALDTINPVIDRWPGDPRFRETRGQILARMQRWKEALPDLEAALTVYPDNAELHRTLAQTYEQLDAPDMAAVHRKRADTSLPRPKSEPAAAPAPSASADH